MSRPDLITILGPTATGKTRLAALLAARISGEVISADSRQVYRGMDIGTGKDLDDYLVDGTRVPCHLTDIANAGETYDVFRYLNDFMKVYKDIRERNKQPVLCGGSGMYLDAVIRSYDLRQAPSDAAMQSGLLNMDDQALSELLSRHRPLHNTTDTSDRERLIRAVEIALGSQKESPVEWISFPVSHLVIGIDLPREIIRQRITQRLSARLNEGLVQEVELLLAGGVTMAQLHYYGLEYRYVAGFLSGMMGYDPMVAQLNTAIHQFAKRQMTWFRRMEKKGIRICWIDGTADEEGRLKAVLNLPEFRWLDNQ